ETLDLLRGLDRARLVEEWLRVDRRRPGVEPGLRVRGRLADHAIRRLRAERELEADASVLPGRGDRDLERACDRRPGIALVVALDETHLARPRGARRVRLRGLDRDQNGVALAREDHGVEPLHPPEIR